MRNETKQFGNVSLCPNIGNNILVHIQIRSIYLVKIGSHAQALALKKGTARDQNFAWLGIRPIWDTAGAQAVRDSWERY